MSIKFFSVNNLPEDIYTCSGCEVVDDYEEVIADEGYSYLVVKGKKNLQAEIQSYKSSTDMATIVARMVDLGIDFGNIPVTIEDGVEDVSSLQNKSNQELLAALDKIDANMKLYEKYKADIEALTKKPQEVNSNE